MPLLRIGCTIGADDINIPTKKFRGVRCGDLGRISPNFEITVPANNSRAVFIDAAAVCAVATSRSSLGPKQECFEKPE